MLKSVFLGIQDTTCKQNLSVHWLPTTTKISLLPLPLNRIVRYLNNDKKLETSRTKAATLQLQKI